MTPERIAIAALAFLLVATALLAADRCHGAAAAAPTVAILSGQPVGIGPSRQIVRFVCDVRGFVAVARPGTAPCLIFVHNLSDYAAVESVSRLPAGSAVYTLPAIDAIAGKSALASSLARCGADRWIPETHFGDDLLQPSDDGPWIWKTNIQRQVGVAITRGRDLPPGPLDAYVVRQRLLQDPLVIAGRKINLRVYVLFWLEDGRLRCAPYHDGFVYYTPLPFEPGSTEIDRNVTTGYISRDVYRTNPLTLGDLRDAMGQRRFDEMWGNILRMLEDVRACYEPILAAQLGRHATTPHFNVLGCDVAPCADLSVYLMEFNKTPDLSAKDDRDMALKEGMVRWAFG